MFRPLSIFIGARYTRAKRRKNFISFISMTSMIGLALGVLAMIVVLSVMNGFQREMSSRILGMVPHASILGAKPVDDWQTVAEAALRNHLVGGFRRDEVAIARQGRAARADSAEKNLVLLERRRLQHDANAIGEPPLGDAQPVVG